MHQFQSQVRSFGQRSILRERIHYQNLTAPKHWQRCCKACYSKGLLSYLPCQTFHRSDHFFATWVENGHLNGNGWNAPWWPCTTVYERHQTTFEDSTRWRKIELGSLSLTFFISYVFFGVRTFKPHTLPRQLMILFLFLFLSIAQHQIFPLVSRNYQIHCSNTQFHCSSTLMKMEN
jgi:hypothetical protein